ncbi:hypothetical protein M9Y10_027512 [Tritrichomonas musculus]|uniref:Phosphatidic acid phosphatase type 2/haloperoxidase domain-containing protein n=1 Tax=Tritrichomonas musculus TaxID=1915356 RepID=A0ABR2GJP6_9EUKA
MTTGENKIVQHPIWDACNSFEMPIVLYLRQIFMIDKTKSFWKKLAIFGSASFITSIPTILYAFGFIEQAKIYASSLVFYALFSSLLKDLFKRRRPSTYNFVQSPPSDSIHSLPSRHTIGITILACFTPIKYQIIGLIALDRILMGKHFVTDCLAGYIIGELCVFCGTQVQNINLLLIILSISMMVWNGAAKILAETIPILMAPPLAYTSFPLAYLSIFAKFATVFSIKKTFPKSDKMKKFVAELFSTSLMIYIIIKFIGFKHPSSITIAPPTVPLYNSSTSTATQNFEEEATSITDELIGNLAEINTFSSL